MGITSFQWVYLAMVSATIKNDTIFLRKVKKIGDRKMVLIKDLYLVKLR